MSLVAGFPATLRTPRPEDCPDVKIAEKIAEYINSGASRLFKFSARVFVSPGKTVVTVFVREETSAESYGISLWPDGGATFNPAKSVPRLMELYRIVKLVHEQTEDPITAMENAQALRADREREGGQSKVWAMSPEARAAMTARMRASRWSRVDRLTEAVLKESGLEECIAKIEAVLAETVGLTDGTRQIVRRRLADRVMNPAKAEVVDESEG